MNFTTNAVILVFAETRYYDFIIKKRYVNTDFAIFYEKSLKKIQDAAESVIESYND